MSGFVLHPEALKRLQETWEFIASDNPEAADRVFREIHDALRALVPFPQLGQVRSDFHVAAGRDFPLCGGF
jgi:plasmid stabilization system protein ParE